MSGRGKGKRNPPGAKRQAEDRKQSQPAKKQKKTVQQQVKHGAEHVPDDLEVLDTLSLNNSGDSEGIGNKKQTAGIIHFDNVFKDLEFTSPPDFEPLRCGDDGLAIHLPSKITDKIKNHEFINLALLLKGSIELEELCSGGTLHINEKGGLESRPKTSKHTIRNIDEWTDAFIIFASVYLAKFPAKNVEILKYMSVIREAASRYPVSAWNNYDQQFRLRQAQESTRQPWSSLNGELWLRLMSNPQYISKRTTGESSGHVNSYPCYAFNEGNCTWKGSCKYKHVCSSCNSSLHGQANCPHTWQRPSEGPRQSFTPQHNQIFCGRGQKRGQYMFRGGRFNRQ